MDFLLCYLRHYFNGLRCLRISRTLILTISLIAAWPGIVVVSSLLVESRSLVAIILGTLLFSWLLGAVSIWLERYEYPLSKVLYRLFTPLRMAFWRMRLHWSALRMGTQMLVRHKIPWAIDDQRRRLRLKAHDIRWRLGVARIQRILDGYVDPVHMLQRAAMTSGVMLGVLCLAPLVAVAAGPWYAVLWAIPALALVVKPIWTLRTQLNRPGPYAAIAR